MTPLVALETLRVGSWSGAAGRHTGVLPLLGLGAFSLAASVGALTLIPPQRQLYCGIMIRTISKEL